MTRANMYGKLSHVRSRLRRNSSRNSDKDTSTLIDPSSKAPIYSTMSIQVSVDRQKPSKKDALVSSFKSCPPTAPLTTGVSLLLVIALIYGTLWGLLGELALPGGPIFGLFFLGLFSYFGGQIIRLLKVPTLVGMMIVGFLLRNIKQINITKDIPEEWGETIRNMALILILLRAGLEVDPQILQKNKATCSKLIFIPFICELCAGGIAAHFLLGMPWIWGFLTGAMLSAVSPAVVLPVMLKLQKKGIGTQNGVPTMVIAVAGIDDVLALTAFEVVLGVTFATGKLAWTIAQGPLEIIIGMVYGLLLGYITWYIPNPSEKSKNTFRLAIMIFGGMFVLYGSHRIHWGAAGALGCICLPFMSSIRWRKDSEEEEEEDNSVEEALAFIWRIIEPFLFGLIGSEIRIEYLQPQTVGLGIATMFIAIALRMVGSMVAAWSAHLSLKEQIFVTFAGLPKATVQAAIGPSALALAKKYNLGPEIEQYGIEILTTAVLVILITAPLGATTIAILAPRLLEKDVVVNSLDKKPEPPVAKMSDCSISMYDHHMSISSYDSKGDRKISTISNDNNTLHNSKL